MASMWRKAMLYLGLGPDDEYDDFDATGEGSVPPTGAARSPGRRSGAGSVQQRDPEPSGSVRTLAPERMGEDTTNGNGHGYGHDHDDLTGDVGAEGERERRRRTGDVGAEGERERRRRAGEGRSGRGRFGSVVRPLPAGKPFVVGPTSFNDAQDVADKFKVNVPVILNLQGVDRDLSRRIIDFASGLCYGLGGQMERVANQVYLLTPSDVEVSAEERRRLRERGYEA
jgi:cell division inhibitor SepF